MAVARGLGSCILLGIVGDFFTAVEGRGAVGVRSPVGVRALVGWHLLSLDAPTVAAVWTWFVARAVGVRLPWTEVAAMFLAVWVLYAADRLLDARVLAWGETEGLEARHLFHYEHRVGFRWGIVAGCLGLAAFLPEMAWDELRLYVLLGALLVGWFLVIHTAGRVSKRPLPKEFVVGVFFAAAVFVPVVAREPGLRRELIVPAVLVGVLCSLNCLFIFVWEGGVGYGAASRWVGWLGVVLVLSGIGLGGVIGWAVATGAAGLVLLHGVRGRVERTALRALGDLVLLGPLVVVAVMRAHGKG